MAVHPLWRPFEVPDDEQVAAARVREHRPARVEVVPPDPRWPAVYEEVRSLLRDALGGRALRIEHVGSTAVPGLWAKPIVDVNLTVADAGDEASYLPDLEAAGLTLRVRQPEWEQHRMLRCDDPLANVHVFSPDAIEPRRTRAFRDWLREHPADRAAYGALKRSLAARGFTDAMHYNNHKAAMIYDIYERIFASDAESPHDPQPRSVGAQNA